MSDFTFVVLAVVAGGVGLLAFSTLFVMHLFRHAPDEPISDLRNLDDNPEAFVLTRAQYHRDALAAYHLLLCQLRGVDLRSDEGDRLMQVVYNGEKL